MHNYLAQHPEIFMSPCKEPYYFAFDLNPYWRIKEISEYLSLFNSARDVKYLGESSPGYMYSEVAAKQIKEFCPNAKIIVMLRNPVDMIYSLHGQLLLTANEDILDFERALAAQNERRQGNFIPVSCDEPKFLFYFDVAKYSFQLKRYINLFGRENIHVILFDDFGKKTAATYKQTLDFLGVDSTFKAALDVHNSAQQIPNLAVRSFLYKRPALKKSFRRVLPSFFINGLRDSLGKLTQPQRPKSMQPVVHSQLTQLFQPEIEELSSLLNRDLNHWLK